MSDVSTVTRPMHIAVLGVAEGSSGVVVELQVAGSERNPRLFEQLLDFQQRSHCITLVT